MQNHEGISVQMGKKQRDIYLGIGSCWDGSPGGDDVEVPFVVDES